MNRILLLFGFLAFSLSSTTLHAQDDWTPGKYMSQALTLTLAKGYVLEQNSHFGFDDGICLLAAYMEKGAEISWNMALDHNSEYVFIGGGDEDASDIDIILIDRDGEVVGQDQEEDNNPVVTFSPPYTGIFTLKLKLYECDASGSFCGLTIMKDYANAVPVSNLDEAIETIISYGSRVNSKYPVKFHDSPNQWCLFGSILGSGETETVSRLNLGDLNHIILAAGDSNLNDADLCLLNNATNQEISCDRDDDAIPALRLSTKESLRYKLQIMNVKSSGKSLIMTAILTE